MKTVDKNNPTPLYYQLREILEEKIHNGEYKAGEKMPTEAELSKVYNVSRVTVRKTIEDMIVDGVLTRNRSESPRVAYPKVNREFNKLSGLSGELGTKHHFTSSILSMSRREASKKEAVHMGLEEGTEILVMRRLRFVEGDPLAVQDVYLNLKYCEGIHVDELKEGSLYKQFERLQLPINNAVQTISARKANPEEAKLLQIHPGDAILDMRRTTYLDNKEILEYSETAFLAEKYYITMTLYPG